MPLPTLPTTPYPCPLTHAPYPCLPTNSPIPIFPYQCHPILFRLSMSPNTRPHPCPPTSYLYPSTLFPYPCHPILFLLPLSIPTPCPYYRCISFITHLNIIKCSFLSLYILLYIRAAE